MRVPQLLIWLLVGTLVAGCAARDGNPANPCINNLRQIDGATQQWAIEHHKDTNAVPTWDDLRPYIRNTLSCPAGGTYTLGPVGGLPACSVPAHEKLWMQTRPPS